ncbi:hypothetical protein VOLCADRAFT_94518 [Volvox carteri f. nagariensis]|uniref:Uncharacterized protein n=1 Tax=Volvox carteri f. nagariensis TaxID=3068 RepID=D8U502_VOLCA|nr:uncharacterized protein VOLCADRAFT_94518 [Volvox carteri f. nagariensis]EFJ45061.1 hypothetical protein VOLCADRAFT_94518 [Volvox carteri f. nagariensis]|eukprot:XP_002953737.1 hypothetical protein VOLCADRAFT_94518 [Volvox carteri f. nagariensis]
MASIFTVTYFLKKGGLMMIDHADQNCTCTTAEFPVAFGHSHHSGHTWDLLEAPVHITLLPNRADLLKTVRVRVRFSLSPTALAAPPSPTPLLYVHILGTPFSCRMALHGLLPPAQLAF